MDNAIVDQIHQIGTDNHDTNTNVAQGIEMMEFTIWVLDDDEACDYRGYAASYLL